MNFTYKNTTVNYTDAGSGTAVVLLHGFLEDHSIYRDMVPDFAKKNRVIAPDLLGHGKTGNIGYIHTMEDQADMVFALLKSLRLRRFVLIGHSMGGYASLAFAKKHITSVKGVCLLNSTPFPDTEEKKQNRDRAIKIVKNDKTGFLTESIPNLFAKENRIRYQADIKQLIDTANKMDKQGIINALEGMKTRKDLSNFFMGAPFKKAILSGNEDTVIDLDSIKTKYNRSDVQLAILKGGHMSYLEDRENCIKALKDFIKTCN